MAIQDQLRELIRVSLPEELRSFDILLEKPKQSSFGDWSTNFALSSFPQVKENYRQPLLWAEALSKMILSMDQGKLLLSAEALAPGFINFRLQKNLSLEPLQKILAHPEQLCEQFGQNRKIIIEYSSPNIAKPFTVGHFRSTIIGDCLANFYEAAGFQVFRDNHLGDWGTQFGKQIVALKKWGDETAIAQSENPVQELVKLYVRFHEEAEKDPSLEDEGRAWFKKLEDNDPEARRIWQLCINWSLAEFKKIYTRLGVHFTENPDNDYFGYGESFFEPFLSDLIEELKASGLAKEGKEGAYLIFFPNDQYPPLMIQKKDGSTLYATRDLATDRWRSQQARYENADGSNPIIVNEVGAEQALYFQQLYAAENLLGWFQAGERVHVKHGLFRFKEGKMSTRKGNVIWLTEVLDKALEKALTLSESQEIAEAVSISALKWNDLRRRSDLMIHFDWDEMLNLQGNSGPYLQYSYARTCSVLRKAKEAGLRVEKELQGISYNEEEAALLSLLSEFKTSLRRATEEFSPYLLCAYLYQLAQTFNTFYNKHSILTSSAERQFRLQLTTAVSLIMKKGLELLGMVALEKM